MVFKLQKLSDRACNMFENDVNMYGIQTALNNGRCADMFENDVNMYGIQTVGFGQSAEQLFENDVNMYGIQTAEKIRVSSNGLRMM